MPISTTSLGSISSSFVGPHSIHYSLYSFSFWDGSCCKVMGTSNKQFHGGICWSRGHFFAGKYTFFLCSLTCNCRCCHEKHYGGSVAWQPHEVTAKEQIANLPLLDLTCHCKFHITFSTTLLHYTHTYISESAVALSM